MKTPYFSVIVPAHNAEERMRRGLDTIRGQTFRDFELIIVCDDCQDRTAEIAREYTDKVYEVGWHNCGKTRNKGLDEARGEWVLFMDDDDWWIDREAFRKIAEAIRKYEEAQVPIDLLAFDFFFQERGLAKQYPGRLFIAIWNKAWRRSFIGDTRFPEVPHSDDVGFAEKTHHRARVQFLEETLYYYNYMRPGSITQKLATGELKTLEEMGLR